MVCNNILEILQFIQNPLQKSQAFPVLKATWKCFSVGLIKRVEFL